MTVRIGRPAHQTDLLPAIAGIGDVCSHGRSPGGPEARPDPPNGPVVANPDRSYHLPGPRLDLGGDLAGHAAARGGGVFVRIVAWHAGYQECCTIRLPVG